MKTRPYKGQVSIGGRRHTAGTGRIIVPGGEDRTRYVAQCKRTYRVSMMTDNGEICHRVCVGHAAMQYLEFPDGSIDSLGSSVAWVNIPKHNHPIIIDVFPGQDMGNAVDEHSFTLSKATSEGSVTLTGRASVGELLINVDSESPTGGKLVVNVDNPDKQGEIIISVAGNALIAADGEVLTSATNLNTQQITDASGQPLSSIALDPKMAQVSAQRIQHGGGAEPMTLGQQTANLFDAILTELGKSLTTTTLGPMPLLNAPQLLALKVQIRTILSQQSFLD